MKRLLYILVVLLVVLFCVGCGNSKEKASPANNIKQERILRDPFRPDHPTRSEVEAERKQKKESLYR